MLLNHHHIGKIIIIQLSIISFNHLQLGRQRYDKVITITMQQQTISA